MCLKVELGSELFFGVLYIFTFYFYTIIHTRTILFFSLWFNTTSSYGLHELEQCVASSFGTSFKLLIETVRVSTRELERVLYLYRKATHFGNDEEKRNYIQSALVVVVIRNDHSYYYLQYIVFFVLSTIIVYINPAEKKKHTATVIFYCNPYFALQF